MTKIVGCGSDITNITYSGYTISRVYACGGQLVYEKETGDDEHQTPEIAIARYTVSGGEENVWYEIGDDDANSAVTKTEVDKWVSQSDYNNMRVLFFYSNCKSVGNGAFSGCNMSSINSWGTITTIGNSAFTQCNNLERVYLCCSMDSVGQRAFANCASLVSVLGTVTTIGDYAFEKNPNLEYVRLYGLTAITTAAFRDCPKLYEFIVPSTVTSIYANAFLRCTGLEKIVFESKTPPAIDPSCFNNTNNCPLVVPDGCKGAYYNGTGWSQYADRIKYANEIQ